MTRFWSRISIFQGKKKKSKRLPAISFDNYTQPEKLKGSYIYGKQLVRIDKIQAAYSTLLETSTRVSFWKLMDPFIQAWYGEMERVCYASQSALIVLNTQYEEVSNALCYISSPLKNQNKKLLEQALQLIEVCLKEWDSIDTSCHDSYQSLESRLMQEESDVSPKLRQCIKGVYQFMQSVCTHHHYIVSQFDLLWQLGSVAMELEPTSDTPLLEVMKSRWQQKYTQQLVPYSTLTDKFRNLLQKSIPARQDFTCAVCLCIWRQPITLQCDHTFCQHCVQQMVCTSCYRFRRKTINRISEGLVKWIKPSPAVYCTCQTLDHMGELTYINKEGACPLCRTVFKPHQCSVNEELTRFIALYFPKETSNEKEDERVYLADAARKRRKSATNVRHGERNRRKSQTNAIKIFQKMQRWSHKWGQNDETSSSGETVVATPSIPASHVSRSRFSRTNTTTTPPQRQVSYDMLLLARRSWMF